MNKTWRDHMAQLVPAARAAGLNPSGSETRSVDIARGWGSIGVATPTSRTSARPVDTLATFVSGALPRGGGR